MEEQIKDLEERLRVTCLVINNIGHIYNGQKEGEIGIGQLVILDLFQRINANLKLSADIFGNIDYSYNQKIPLALLIRACLSDSLTGIYLLSHNADEYMEELDVLNLDFVKYIKSMLPLEIEFFNYIRKENNSSQPQFDRRYEIFEKYLKSQKGEPWQVKTRDEFRKSGDKTPLTFDKMRDYIKKKGEDDNIPIVLELSYMYNYYRYFSQYEHYTFTGRHFVKQPFDDDLLQIKYALLLIMTSILFMTSILNQVTKEVKQPLENALKIAPQSE